MYYFPPKVKMDDKMKNVGLSEAIIQFTKTFSKKQCCESLHSEKTRHYYFSPEVNFYMVMVSGKLVVTGMELFGGSGVNGV
ncbi:vacuolar fusion protein ccz1 [Homalodisca vitripennis]|nr:vacuolar fusion protein ccz1 [Homalodisca vitripennis]